MDYKLQQLEYYCQHQLPIFPVHWVVNGFCSCGSSKCTSRGKHPLLAHGFKSATTNFGEVQNWHARWPEANWAVRSGDADLGGGGLLIVDLDYKSGGFEVWDSLREDYPGPIETVTVQSGNGGHHLWFAYPPGVDIHSGAGVLGPGVDLRANGGYALVPPSRTTQEYRFLIDPIDTPIQACPEWILSMLNLKEPTPRLPAGIRIGLDIPQGLRHPALLTMSGAMRRIGMTPQEIIAALTVVRDNRFELGDHSVTDEEIINVADWVGQRKRSFALTDLGNGERFIELFGGAVRYCYEWEQWLVWDGRRWLINANAELMQMAHSVVRSIYFEAGQESKLEKRKEIINHAKASEASKKVEAMLASCRPYLAVKADQLDQHPMLLNVGNGIIDLTSGLLLSHDPSYLFTKIIDVIYDPNAKCPQWEFFLDLVTGGDKDLQYFLKLAVGYTLTGQTDEHTIFVLFGTGANGKSTWTEAIRQLFMDYSQRINIDTLLQSKSNGLAATPEVASIKGARYVLSSEIPENRKLNESLIKDLTGSDAVTSRFLYSNPFTFTPTHKLWLYGNHKPQVTGNDEGIWRRIRVIPFSVTVPKEKRRKMSEVLLEFQNERPGILTWAVNGCILWQANGLILPDSVDKATADYRNEQDVLQQFLEEKCEMHVDYSLDKGDLYKAWREWCELSGEKDASRHSQKWLTQHLTSRGFRLGGGQNRIIYGIRVKN